jgi:hypothetical protein
MLKTDSEKEESSAFGICSEKMSAGSDGPLLVKSVTIAGVGDDSQSEIEALRQIYEEICAIRQRHARLMDEKVAKRAENQHLLDAEKLKLVSLEEEHRETGHRLKSLSSGSDEQKSCMVKYRTEQEELENQRRIIDDLEFQMLESEAQYDEQKESIQQQLMLEQKMLADVERQNSAKSSSTCYTDEINTSHLLSTCNHCDVRDDELSQTQNDDHGVCLLSCGSDSGHCDCSSTEQVVPNIVNNNTSLSSDTSSLKDQQICVDDDHSESVADTSNCSSSGRRISPGQDRTAADSGSTLCQSHLEVETSADGLLHDTVSPYQSTSYDRSLDSDEWSNTSSERHLDKETDVNERIREIRQLLIKAEVEKTRLLEQVKASDDTALCRGSSRTESKTKRLHFEKDEENDTPDEENNIIRRHNVRSQARPLTRYLPVRDQHLDLLNFVEQAGHYVEHCAADVTVTSDCARGFLVKMGGRIRTWRRRWFVFDRVRRNLAYYGDQSEHRKPRGCISFSAIEDVFVFDRLSSVKSPSPELTFCVKTARRTYYIVAPTSESRQLWMDIIFTGAEGYKEFI